MQSLSFWHLLSTVPPLLLVEGFFSGSEIALLSADKIQLKKNALRGHTLSARALALTTQPERIFSTTLLITNLCMVAISALISLYFFSRGVQYGGLYSIFFSAVLVVGLGELLPKTLYQRHATRVAPWVAIPVSCAYWSFFPLTRLLTVYTQRLSRVMEPFKELSLDGIGRSIGRTHDELRTLLSYSKKETEIKTSEKRMIKRIFDFRYAQAKHALIPLVQVDAVDIQSQIKEALEQFERHQHSRMPVYDERIDNIIGILEIRDLLGANDLTQNIKNFISPAHYVAETQALEELLTQMRQDDNEMVIVVDEHGGAVGILTFEDIVEEIVGEISDEYDQDTSLYKQISETSWILQAKMNIQQINDALRLGLPEGDYETLSGFLLQQFGRIPETREELIFETNSGSYRFVIQNATDRHIESVIVQKIENMS